MMIPGASGMATMLGTSGMATMLGIKYNSLHPWLVTTGCKYPELRRITLDASTSNGNNGNNGTNVHGALFLGSHVKRPSHF